MESNKKYGYLIQWLIGIGDLIVLNILFFIVYYGLNSIHTLAITGSLREVVLLLNFCYLVNPFFPSLKMKKEMRANFDILLSEYPSGLNVNSLLIAKYFGLAQQYVCPGNGAAELIKYLVDELTGCLGVVYPTFEEYPNRMQEDKVIAYVPQNKDFSYTADDLMAFFAVVC